MLCVFSHTHTQNNVTANQIFLSFFLFVFFFSFLFSRFFFFLFIQTMQMNSLLFQPVRWLLESPCLTTFYKKKNPFSQSDSFLSDSDSHYAHELFTQLASQVTVSEQRLVKAGWQKSVSINLYAFYHAHRERSFRVQLCRDWHCMWRKKRAWRKWGSHTVTMRVMQHDTALNLRVSLPWEPGSKQINYF